MAKAGNALSVSAACAKAMELGLLPGLSLADARARVPDVRVADADPTADERLLLRLADMAERWSPMVEPASPDGLILDISGVAHLFGGEAELAADALGLLQQRQLAVKHAIASTPLGARGLARFGPAGGVGDEAQVIRNLPVAALGLSGDAAAAMRKAGLKRIGDLADRPTAPLAARFGKEAVYALDRMLGRADSRISPRRRLPALSFARRFAEPIAHVETVLAAIDELMRKAAWILERRHAGGRAFAVRLYRSDGGIRELFLETGQPTRDPALLQRLLRERVEALSDPLDPGFGFDLLRLNVAATEPLMIVQADLAAPARTGEALEALIDRLSTRHGRARILQIRPVDTHVPERAAKAFPAQGQGQPEAWPGRVEGEPPARPVCLFDPPQPVEVLAEVPDAPPRRFTWQGRSHTVIRAEGPERIAAPWWQQGDGGRPTRDYYRLEDEAGRRFWLFRRGLYGRESTPPRWYLHGLFA